MKTKFHYHVCDCGRWKCGNHKCNLSSHAKCGFKRGNDFTTCIKGRPMAAGLQFETIANKLIKKEIGRSRFFCDAVRLNLNTDQAKAQLRDYRKQLRQLAKKKEIKTKSSGHILTLLEPDTFLACA